MSVPVDPETLGLHLEPPDDAMRIWLDSFKLARDPRRTLEKEL